MIERPATWGEVSVGTTLLSPTEEPLLVIRMVRGWYQLKDRSGHKMDVRPKPATEPVTILEVTESEAILLAQEKLNASALLHIEREKRMPKRQHRWEVEPFPRAGQRDALTRARDHLSFHHGTYSGSAENGGFKNLKQITAAHTEMHDPDAVGGLFMDLPHHHREK